MLMLHKPIGSVLDDTDAMNYRKGAGKAGDAGTKVTDLPYNPTSSSGVILCPVMSICNEHQHVRSCLGLTHSLSVHHSLHPCSKQSKRITVHSKALSVTKHSAHICLLDPTDNLGLHPGG